MSDTNEVPKETKKKFKIPSRVRLLGYEIRLWPLIISSLIIIVALVFCWYFKSRNSADEIQVVTEKPRSFKASDVEASIERNVSKTDSHASSRSHGEKYTNRNYQTEIAAYIHEERSRENPGSEPTSAQKLRMEKKLLGLPPGTKIPAFTSGTIFSFNVEAPVSVIVSKDILSKEDMVIPKNSKFLGTASVLKSLNRINVSFQKLIFPDGRELNVRAIALSEDGSSGIRGKVDKQGGKKFLRGMAEAIVGGATLFSNSLSQDAYSLQDEIRGNLSENLLSDARSHLREERIETSITVEGFTPVEVLLLEGV